MGPPCHSPSPEKYVCRERRAKASRCRSSGTSQLSGARHRADERRNRAWLSGRARAVILVDANIPMYLIGNDEIHKARAQRLLTSLMDLVVADEVHGDICIDKDHRSCSSR